MPTIFIFLIILSIVVLIHELGHFLAAKKVGVKVEEFGLGYPPRVWGKKIGETIYSLNWLPFGGFVRLYGEMEEGSEKTKSKRAFYNQSKKEKALVILAGVFMNLILAIGCFSLIYSLKGIPEEVDYVMIDGVASNSPAEEVGIIAGDRLLAVDGKEITRTDEFVEYLGDKGGVEVLFEYQRGNEILESIITPRENPPAGEGAVGVAVSNYDNIFYPVWQMPFRGTWVGIQEAFAWTKMMFGGLAKMVVDGLTGKAPEVSGIVGIYQATGQVAEMGILALVKFVGILSINLAVVNILPFPALDGGRMAFLLLEKVIGKKMKPIIEAKINMVGMMILIGLMAVITVLDVKRLIIK